LFIDFRRMKPVTLKKYTDMFDIPVRPELAPVEIATSVARHFDSFLEVDEDEVIGKFMNAARRIPPSSVTDNAPKRLPTQRRTGGGDPGLGGGFGRGAGNSDMLNTDEAMDAFEASGYADDYGRPVANKRFSAQSTGGASGGQAGGVSAGAQHDTDGAHGYEGGPFLTGAVSSAAVARPAQGGNGAHRAAAAASGVVRSAGGAAAASANRVSATAGVAAATWTAASASTADAEQEETLYCLCNRPSFGEMIACDNNSCKVEWFHLPCVGLSASNRPRGKWFCPDCSKDTSLNLTDDAEAELVNENGKRRRS
jgi:hypothetical protein